MNRIKTICLGLILIAAAISADAKQTALADEKPQAATAPLSFSVSVQGQGSALILIPDLGCPGAIWQPTAGALKDNYQCHLLTPAGFAGQPPASATPYLELLRDDLARYIIDSKLERPVLIGQGLGGVVALWLAAKEPTLPGAVISVDGPPFAPALLDSNATAISVRSMALQRRRQSLTQPLSQFEMQNAFLLRTQITGEADVEKMAAWWKQSDRTTLAEAQFELATTDLRQEVGSIEVPVLLIGSGGLSGGNTQFLQALAEQYKKQLKDIPNHQFKMLEEARHFILLDAPDELLNTLEAFLREIE